MYSYRFGKRSRSNLKGVDDRLVRICNRALQLSPIDFGITEGIRSVERQRFMVASGRSDTMNSRHLTGLAVDIVAYKNGGVVTWDFETYRTISRSFIRAGWEYETAVTWGGDWPRLRDGVHFQIDAKRKTGFIAGYIKKINDVFYKS